MATFDSKRIVPLRVTVLAGGPSMERQISLESGAAVTAALEERGHSVTLLDPCNIDLRKHVWDETDVVFLALHGTFGEDGSVQCILEEIGIPFTGSDSVASRLAFSKSASKERFLQCGVPTPSYVLLHETDDMMTIRAHARTIGYPLVVKPDRQGSSLGVTIIQSEQELGAAVARCFKADSFGVLEPAVRGTEWTVGFLNGTMLPPIQIVTDREFYDYQAKYEDDTTRYEFDSPMAPTVIELIGRTASRACAALATQGISRVDLRVDQLYRPWVLELNTIPGFTSHSLVPKAAQRAGMDLGMLCERAILGCLANPEADTIVRTA